MQEELKQKLPKKTTIEISAGVARRKILDNSVDNRRMHQTSGVFLDTLLMLVQKGMSREQIGAYTKDLVEQDKQKGFVVLAQKVFNHFGVADPKFIEKIKADKKFKRNVDALSRVSAFKLSKKQKKQHYKEIEAKLIPFLIRTERYSMVGMKGYESFMVDHFNLKRHENLRNRFYISKNPEVANIWVIGMTKLQADYKAGKIKNKKEFIERYEEVVEKSVAKTEDKELQEQWEAYKESDERRNFNTWFGASTPEVAPMRSGDKPIVNEKDKKEAVVSARAEISSVPNFEIDTDAKGNASVIIDNDIRVKLVLFKEEGSGDLVYYILDENLSGGPLRVKASELLSALYDRHIDGLFQRFAGSPKFALELSQIPDRDLIRLGNMLLGSGKDKDYELSPDDKMVMEILVKILRNRDPKHSSLQSKVDAINHFLTIASRGAQMRKVLLKEKDNNSSVTEIISSSGDTSND